jgi:broad specificity phosphatase PhoE
MFVIRHSKSCSNYMRQIAGSDDERNSLVRASKELLDPELSAVGRSMAEHYRPILHQRLTAAGFDIETATIGSSGLRRARNTAQLLFPGRTVHHLPHIKEYGNIPENTPMATKRCRPDWRAFLKHLATLPASQFAVVGHGSFLRVKVWQSLTNKPHGRFHNLDGMLITAILTKDGDLLHPHIEEFKYQPPAYISDAADQCSVAVERKIAAHYKMPRMTEKWKRSRRQSRSQRGGANMPLAYFQDGAQMNGTYAENTGTGLAGTSSSWVRAPLNQTGGRRTAQHGGFSPSVMGSFLVNGSRLIPVAGFMGYRMLEKSGKTRKGSRKHRGHRRTRRDRK